MQKKHVLMFVGILATLAILMTGCGGNKQEPQGEEQTVVTTTKPLSLTTNILTGQEEAIGNNTRPVAFMIDNYSSTILQKNIDKADFYVEAETEGGISRIMAVFGSIEKVPAEVAPVRSARSHFVKMVKSIDAIYCHVGGSTIGKQLISELKVADLDSLAIVSNELKAVNGASEHTKVFTLEKINAALQSRNIATTTALKSPYKFGDKAGSGLGNKVQVNISSSWRSSFVYDPATKLYTKNRNTLESAEHKSYDGQAITVSNVIVMYDQRYQEDSGHISFKLESGKGLLVSGGTSREINWSRTNNQLSFFETDGTPLTVAKGKTYVCLTSAQLESRTVLQ